MNKIDKMGVYVKETGVDVPMEILEQMLKEEKKRKRAELQSKFEKRIITLEELEELMVFRYGSTKIKMLYGSFYKMNMKKLKPKEITHNIYGKFIDMLTFLSYKNSLAYSNGRTIKVPDLIKYLEFKNIRAFNSFIKKLTVNEMVAESKVGGINFLFINPAYAQRNMAVNSTIFRLFKKDLIEYLDEYQIRYLAMCEDDVDISSIIPLDN